MAKKKPKKIIINSYGANITLNLGGNNNGKKANFKFINSVPDEQVFKSDEPHALSDIQVINMKDEREEQDFLKMGLLEKLKDLTITDVNSATVSQLEKLLYINETSINKIINFRADGGVFYSQDEFFDFIDLKPHERKALKPYISTGESILEKTAAARPKNRRIIDY